MIFDHIIISLELLLVSIGITTIIVEGTLFDFLKQKFTALACSLCTGFWSGLIWSFICVQKFDLDYLLYYFSLGVLSSIFSYIFVSFFRKIE